MNFISGVDQVICKGKKLIKLLNYKNIKSLYDKADVDENFNISPLIL